jgi:hypothetical protein
MLVADRQAVVYEASRVETFTNGEHEPVVTVGACAYGHRVRLLLEEDDIDGTYSSGISFAQLTLAGTVLAYEEYRSGEDRYGTSSGPRQWWVVVRDLATGRLLHRVAAGTDGDIPGEVGDGGVEELIAEGDGSAAWIAQDGWRLALPPLSYQVWDVERSARHLLASGADILPDSLARAGSFLYWTQGGVPFEAPLN